MIKKLLPLLVFWPLLSNAQPTPPPPATQAEVNAGVIHNKFVAPDTLQGKLNTVIGPTNGVTATTVSNIASFYTVNATNNKFISNSSGRGTNTLLADPFYVGGLKSTNAYLTIRATASQISSAQILQEGYTGDSNSGPWTFVMTSATNNWTPGVNAVSPYQSLPDIQLHYGYNMTQSPGYRSGRPTWVRGHEMTWFNPFNEAQMELYDRLVLTNYVGSIDVGFAYTVGLPSRVITAALLADTLDFKNPRAGGVTWLTASVNTNNAGVLTFKSGYIDFFGQTNEWLIQDNGVGVLGSLGGANYLFSSGGSESLATLFKGGSTANNMQVNFGTTTPRGIRWNGTNSTPQFEYQEYGGTWRGFNDEVSPNQRSYTIPASTAIAAASGAYRTLGTLAADANQTSLAQFDIVAASGEGIASWRCVLPSMYYNQVTDWTELIPLHDSSQGNTPNLVIDTRFNNAVREFRVRRKTTAADVASFGGVVTVWGGTFTVDVSASGTGATVTGYNPATVLIQKNGKVGINTNSPQFDFHVNGEAFIEQGITANSLESRGDAAVQGDLEVTKIATLHSNAFFERNITFGGSTRTNFTYYNQGTNMAFVTNLDGTVTVHGTVTGGGTSGALTNNDTRSVTFLGPTNYLAGHLTLRSNLSVTNIVGTIVTFSGDIYVPNGSITIPLGGLDAEVVIGGEGYFPAGYFNAATVTNSFTNYGNIRIANPSSTNTLGGTNALGETYLTNGVWVGGVRRTTWPSGGGGTYFDWWTNQPTAPVWFDGSSLISSNNLHTNYFSVNESKLGNIHGVTTISDVSGHPEIVLAGDTGGASKIEVSGSDDSTLTRITSHQIFVTDADGNFTIITSTNVTTSGFAVSNLVVTESISGNGAGITNLTSLVAWTNRTSQACGANVTEVLTNCGPAAVAGVNLAPHASSCIVTCNVAGTLSWSVNMEVASLAAAKYIYVYPDTGGNQIAFRNFTAGTVTAALMGSGMTRVIAGQVVTFLEYADSGVSGCTLDSIGGDHASLYSISMTLTP